DRSRASRVDVESRIWHSGARKEDAIRAAGMTATRYYQVLNSLTARADGWEYAPVALGRVERLRARLRRSG
ncbi:DUF3263 domain-containing protein, partial [Agrobacterium sp. S2]|nr:DUF3263 domain-containing protein [Agrobacterium sp. S2]